MFCGSCKRKTFFQSSSSSSSSSECYCYNWQTQNRYKMLVFSTVFGRLARGSSCLLLGKQTNKNKLFIGSTVCNNKIFSIEMCTFKATLCNYSTFKYQLQNPFDAALTCNRVNGASVIPTLHALHLFFLDVTCVAGVQQVYL